MSRTSDRLGRLPYYAVNELAAAKKRMLAEGVDVIDLSVGDADIPPPEVAVRTLHEALSDQAMSRYSFQIGLIEFREAVARYMERRFGVVVDPMAEVLPLIGSKNGLSHLPFAILNTGDICIIPEPGYPGYFGTYLTDAEVLPYPLRAERQFLIELEDLSADQLARTGLAFLNYPNNPTSAIAPRDYLERTVRACHEHDIVLAYDNPYCEMTFDGYVAPSVLEIPTARDVTLEFHSLSKSFCMTGWRLGWAVGSSELIAALQKVKSYVDTGPFLAVQRAGAAVLDNAEPLVAEMQREFQERRDAAVRCFREVGFEVEAPKATMYLWIELPSGVTSVDFAQRVLEEQGVAVLPGSALGSSGEGYFRIALTVGAERTREAAARIGRVLNEVRETSARA
ncbi:MAG: aminotransferase class I/II-fold pyridoxal phosphate-dependent enzyme [Gemmatimonadota bacterium]|nr:MAG: aminotransferase class I/II-fold pyridoxal phosphate-dependent enzyme [Gemmatimonadota bacterium]